MALTGKKKVFADAVLAGSTNKDAAIKAGYSAKTAFQSGSRLVKDSAVAEYLVTQRAAGGKPAPDPVPAATATANGPKFDLAAAMQHTDPKVFLTAAMNDVALDAKQRIIAAKALMPFVHGKIADQGKKDAAKDAAQAVGKGKFAVGDKPKLVSVSK